MLEHYQRRNNCASFHLHHSTDAPTFRRIAFFTCTSSEPVSFRLPRTLHSKSCNYADAYQEVSSSILSVSTFQECFATFYFLFSQAAWCNDEIWQSSDVYREKYWCNNCRCLHCRLVTSWKRETQVFTDSISRKNCHSAWLNFGGFLWREAP